MSTSITPASGASGIGGLGRVPHFDPRNLDYLIKDAPGLTPEIAHGAKSLAVIATHGASGVHATLNGPPVPLPKLGSTATSAAYAAAVIAVSRRLEYEPPRVHLNQGETSRCTAGSTMRALVAGPVTQPVLAHDWANDPTSHAMPATADAFMSALYAEIQAVDRREGRNFPDGATSLALAKAGQARGWWTSYRWGYSLDDLVAAFALADVTGASTPPILGLDWYKGMDTPDASGMIRATGAIRGGHEILCDAIDVAKGRARLANTWGPEWGHGGYAWLPLDDLAMLIATGGDVVLLSEVKLARATPTHA